MYLKCVLRDGLNRSPYTVTYLNFKPIIFSQNFQMAFKELTFVWYTNSLVKALTHETIRYWFSSRRGNNHLIAHDSHIMRHIIRGVMSHRYNRWVQAASTKCATSTRWIQNKELSFKSSRSGKHTDCSHPDTLIFNRCDVWKISSLREKKPLQNHNSIQATSRGFTSHNSDE